MIKIFVCSHINNQNIVQTCKQYEFLYPLQVGCTQNNEFKGYYYDNIKDNISSLNPYYCELTGHYWVWKNQKADYYGFFHYRRFLDFNLQNKKIYSYVENFSKINYQNAQELIKQYDIILPKKEKFYTDIYTHYAQAPNHFKSDLDLVISIIKKLYPEFTQVLEEFLKNDELYVGNIFIMKNEIFQQYSKWLFDILAEFDLQNIHKNSRSNGYLAERLLGIYIAKLKTKDIKILELPRLHLVENKYKLVFKKTTNLIFPPSSNQRLLVKKFGGTINQ